ncbi:MAG: hypothetical protein AAF721_03955 [Myxococcota bacterium]
MTRHFVASCALLLACGPSIEEPPVPLEPAELASVCGQPSPMRVLALAPDETLIPKGAAVTRIDERVYFIVKRPNAEVGSTTLYSTGPCGEEPRTLAQDVDHVFSTSRWPGALIGYTTDEDVVAIDPLGEREPTTLLTGVPLTRGWSDYGVVTRGRTADGVDDGALVLHPYPATTEDEEPEPVVLAEGDVRLGGIRVQGPLIFYGWGDGDVWLRNLDDGSTALQAERVDSFDVTADGRVLTMQRRDHDDDVIGVYALDRDSGQETLLGETATARFMEGDHVWFSTPNFETRMVYTLPELERIETPAPAAITFRVDETRWLAWCNPREHLLFDTADGMMRSLTTRTFQSLRAYGDRIDLLADIEPSEHEEGSLHTAWYAGGEELLADRATPDYGRHDHRRIITPLAAEEGGCALALSDGYGRTRWEVDSGVSRRSQSTG